MEVDSGAARLERRMAVSTAALVASSDDRSLLLASAAQGAGPLLAVLLASTARGAGLN